MASSSSPNPSKLLGIPIGATEKRFRQRADTAESVQLESRVEPVSAIEKMLRSNDGERLKMRLRRAGIELPSAATRLKEFAVAGDRAAVSRGLESNEEGRVDPEAATTADAFQFFERIIGKRDFVSARFLEAGARAARAVGRVRIRTRAGGAGFGTGSLVAPRLMLTNHHVLSDPGDAKLSAFELNVQDGVDGRPLTPQLYKLVPADFFFADEKLDFCLVAVKLVSEGGVALEEFGWNTPFEEDDPVVVEEYVNIIQHPDGRPKEIALRDNQVTDILPEFLHYRADTEPGSSGAPVFSDNWELVGLHHSGVPRKVDGKIVTRDGQVWREELGEGAIDWIANEGVRISRILAAVKEITLRDAKQKALRNALFQAAQPVNAAPPAVSNSANRSNLSTEQPSEEPGMQPDSESTVETSTTVTTGTGQGSTVRVTIPLQLAISLGTPVVGGGGGGVARITGVGDGAGLDLTEAVTIDPNYGDREGYDPEFLGTGARELLPPRLSTTQRKVAAVVQGAPAENPFELKYHHYSVVLNARRRLAFFTAVNIDGKLAKSPTRDRDRWFFDPRVDRGQQVGDDLYKGTFFDRGHLVRRLDPAWGRNDTVIKVANDDTFHFTNCSPQHKKFNESATLWAGLEDYLLERAVDDRKRLTVFTGPVFTADDPVVRGVAIPQQFWKVAVIVRPNGKLAALGFVVSQAELIKARAEEAAIDVARTFQVPVKQIATLTGLDFGPLARLDGGTVEGFGREAVGVSQPLESFDDIVLPDGEEHGGEESVPSGRASVTAPRRARRADALEDEEGVGGGPPYILVSFDDTGRERTDAPGGLASDRVVAALESQPITDVFLMSHGWMGDVPAARDQYRRWSAVMANVTGDVTRARQLRPGFKPLIVGIHWPSKPWGDEQLTPDESVAEAVIADPVKAMVEDYISRLGHAAELRKPLRTIISEALSGQPHRKMPKKVADAYKEVARALRLTGKGVGAAPGEDADKFDAEAIFEQSRAREAVEEGVPGAEAFEFPSADSLLDPLRMASFWTMKGRGRLVGERGGYPFLLRLLNASDAAKPRFHLMGHSFGGIVISAAVAGPPGAAALPRPVHSMCIVQGALSLWSYCTNIPVQPGTPGYFRRILQDKLVYGPIVTTRTDYDRALRIFYPRGAQLAMQVEEAVAKEAVSFPKYGAVGVYGLQGPGLKIGDELIKRADAPYAFKPGQVVNLDANGVIRNGSGAAGAHSDIDHPEVAHAIWSAALVE